MGKVVPKLAKHCSVSKVIVDILGHRSATIEEKFHLISPQNSVPVFKGN